MQVIELLSDAGLAIAACRCEPAAAVGVNRIGPFGISHFGFFRPPFEATPWPRLEPGLAWGLS